VAWAVSSAGTIVIPLTVSAGTGPGKGGALHACGWCTDVTGAPILVRRLGLADTAVALGPDRPKMELSAAAPDS